MDDKKSLWCKKDLTIIYVVCMQAFLSKTKRLTPASIFQRVFWNQCCRVRLSKSNAEDSSAIVVLNPCIYIHEKFTYITFLSRKITYHVEVEDVAYLQAFGNMVGSHGTTIPNFPMRPNYHNLWRFLSCKAWYL